eukprot:c34219_g1_i1 orf=327-773(-)
MYRIHTILDSPPDKFICVTCYNHGKNPQELMHILIILFLFPKTGKLGIPFTVPNLPSHQMYASDKMDTVHAYKWSEIYVPFVWSTISTSVYILSFIELTHTKMGPCQDSLHPFSKTKMHLLDTSSFWFTKMLVDATKNFRRTVMYKLP